MLYILLNLTWQSNNVFLRICLKNFLIRILLLTFILIELDLRAIEKKKKEEAKAIDLIFRLIVVNCIEFAIDNAYYNRNCTCED
jgi:hypothetical protein